MNDDILGPVAGANGGLAGPDLKPLGDVPDDFLKPIETGGQAAVYMRDKGRREHLCFRCSNAFIVTEVVQTAGDVGQVMKEKQTTCLVAHQDVTNETRLKCSHFSRRWGLLGWLADAVNAIR